MKLLFAVKNVAAHADEMGEAAPVEPVFFLKPQASLQRGSRWHLPTDMGRIEFEVELAVQVGRALSRADPREASEAISAVGVVLDLTARDLQAERKKAGLPWLEAKGFDGSCVLGGLASVQRVDVLDGLSVRLAVNGEERQRFQVADYRVGPAELLVRASHWMRLDPGDVLGCGTGAGVGPLVEGDEVVAELVGLEETRVEGRVVEGPT